MAENKYIDKATGTETVGHEWDGIEELDTPMPRWWVWTFYATIVWGIVYTVLYPAWPMINDATKGVWGWSSRGQLSQEMAKAEEKRAPVRVALAALPIGELPGNKKLMNAAIQGGAAAFKVHCVQCHGSGASGSPGYPNLNDDDWLWGGDIASIQYTIEHGVRQPDHDATRLSQMPAFGGILSGGEINALVGYVRSLSGNGTGSARGAELFTNNCAACHGTDGKGLREFGAPNLTDKIWLYGGDAETVRATITNSRYGVMPRWNEKLDPITIKMLAAFVHSRGGGEANPVSGEDASAAGGQIQ